MASLEDLTGREPGPGEKWRPSSIGWVFWLLLLVRTVWRLQQGALYGPWQGIAVLPIQVWALWVFLQHVMFKRSAAQTITNARLDLWVQTLSLVAMLAIGSQHEYAGVAFVATVTLMAAYQIFAPKELTSVPSVSAFWAVFFAFSPADTARLPGWEGTMGISVMTWFCVQRMAARKRELARADVVA